MKFNYKLLLIFVLAFCQTLSSQTRTERNLLAPYSRPGFLDSCLVKDWHPFPDVSGHKLWKAMAGDELMGKYIHEGDRYLGYKWEVLPVNRFMDYYRNGNRSKYENLLFGRRKALASLVMAEVMDGRGRYLEDIINGIWAISEETFWGVPAHTGEYLGNTHGLPDPGKQVVDLFNAETGSLVAWTYYLLAPELDSVSPFIRQRMYDETERRLLKPIRERDFGWMGFNPKNNPNNWDPWINSNLITCILLMEKDHQKRDAGLQKCMSSLDQFMNSYPADGGCDEGPGYWSKAGGSLADALDLLYSASGEKINIWNNPLIGNMAAFVYKAFIAGNYYVNFADASLTNNPDPVVIYTLGKRLNDSRLVSFASYLAKEQHFGEEPESTSFGSLFSILRSFSVIPEISKTIPDPPYIFDSWLPETQYFYARSSRNSSGGFYLAGQGGHNAESHNHNDVGNFIVFYDGKPLIIDAGVGEYTAQTFGKNRYNIWTMQSAYHNVPTINGVMQSAGREFRATHPAFKSNDKQVTFKTGIEEAYPAKAAVKSWDRTITLNRGRNIILDETYELSKFIEPFYLSFMSVAEPLISKQGIIRFSLPGNKVFSMHYDPALFEGIPEKIEINDSRLSPVWGKCIYRTKLISKSKLLKGRYKIEIQEN